VRVGEENKMSTKNDNYFFSPVLAATLKVAVNRMRAGHGAALFLEGPPGGGKTSFARALASALGGRMYYYTGSPDKERDLLYEIDVKGVLTRENAWVKGPAWEAFEASTRGEFAVLLIDEIDKTNPGFDAFLLRLLEEWTFRSPEGEEVKADPTKLAVVLTTNGRRKIRPEVLRRCQRATVPLPSGELLQKIVRQIADFPVPEGILDLVIRIGENIRQAGAENAPSPKELAFLCVDLLALAEAGEWNPEVWRQIASGWLVKAGGPEAIDKAVPFRWVRALIREVKKIQR